MSFYKLNKVFLSLPGCLDVEVRIDADKTGEVDITIRGVIRTASVETDEECWCAAADLVARVMDASGWNGKRHSNRSSSWMDLMTRSELSSIAHLLSQMGGV